MGPLFSIMALILIIGICAILAAICLLVARKPVSFGSITIFTFTGGLIGLLTIFVWGLLFANEGGTIESGAMVLGMFALAGFLAAIGGFYFSSICTKKTNQFQRFLRSGWEGHQDD